MLMGVLGVDKVCSFCRIDACNNFIFGSQDLAPLLTANKRFSYSFGGNCVSVRSMASMMPVQSVEDGRNVLTGKSFIRPHLLELSPYQPILPFEVLSTRLGRKPEDIIKLDANENPYGPPPEACCSFINKCCLNELISIKKFSCWSIHGVAAANSQNAYLVTRTPDLTGSDTICRILYPIELPFIPKPIGDRKRYNNSFMVRARARSQL